MNLKFQSEPWTIFFAGYAKKPASLRLTASFFCSPVRRRRNYAVKLRRSFYGLSFFAGFADSRGVNAKNIAILVALAAAGIAIGIFARGYSDAKLWTTPT